jgi:hypothetical protein
MADLEIAANCAKSGLKRGLNFVFGAKPGYPAPVVGPFTVSNGPDARAADVFETRSQFFVARLRFPPRRGAAVVRTMADS